MAMSAAMRSDVGALEEGEALVPVWEYQVVSYLVPVQVMRKIKVEPQAKAPAQPPAQPPPPAKK
jgi:hypothetical protein